MKARSEMALHLDLIAPRFRDEAIAALDESDVGGFLIFSEHGNQFHLRIVWQNINELKIRGLYEEALLFAFTSARVNNHHWPLDVLIRLFKLADRDCLRAAGDPLRGPGPFTIYRGVAGRTRARRIRGLSWTGSLERAQWFAERGEYFGFADPAVYQVTVDADAVLAYDNGRNEQEFIVMLPGSVKPVRVKEKEE